MAHIFKHPSVNSDGSREKGIVVFTHKELFRFSKNFLDLEVVGKISKRYFIGCHLGGYVDGYKMPAFVDFCMGPPEVGRIRSSSKHSLFRIPLNSKNFIESYFVPDEYKGGIWTPSSKGKEWDIISVANFSKIKKQMELVQSVERMYKTGRTDIRVLMVSPPGDKAYQAQVLNYYSANFKEQWRDNFKILIPNRKLSKFGNKVMYSSKYLSILYKKSSIFTLFSTKEGCSKVVAEALLSGLPVVTYRRLKGGGRNDLSSHNSMSFESYKNSYKALIKAVDRARGGVSSGARRPFQMDIPFLQKKYFSRHSLIELNKWFERLYINNDSKFTGGLINTDNLKWRLPAHISDKIPWSGDDGAWTSDIRTKKQWRIFLKNLKIGRLG